MAVAAFGRMFAGMGCPLRLTSSVRPSRWFAEAVLNKLSGNVENGEMWSDV